MYSLITLISDYGPSSPYTASIIGAAYTHVPNAALVEITNCIAPYEISQAAFILKGVCKNYPKGTWHVIGLDSSVALHKQFLIIEHQGHYFIGADNGVFSMLFEPNEIKVFKVLPSWFSSDEMFAEKNVFIPIIAKFFEQKSLEGIAIAGTIENKMQSIQPTIEASGINGVVMWIDGYNNAITNINKKLFEEVVNGKKFKLFYWGRHFISKISKHYHDEVGGEDMLVFNENNYLEIAMNKGRGAQLLGLKQGSKIMIEVEPD